MSYWNSSCWHIKNITKEGIKCLDIGIKGIEVFYWRMSKPWYQYYI